MEADKMHLFSIASHDKGTKLSFFCFMIKISNQMKGNFKFIHFQFQNLSFKSGEDNVCSLAWQNKTFMIFWSFNHQ